MDDNDNALLTIVVVHEDGLDMSAIREVKFLQELRHPNVIEVGRSNHNMLCFVNSPVLYQY